MDPAPIQLGPFTLLGKIGEGGIGVVYKARDTRLDRLFAIKLLPNGKLAGGVSLGVGGTADRGRRRSKLRPLIQGRQAALDPVRSESPPL